MAPEFRPAPRWGNSPLKRYPLIPGTVLASALSVPASVKGNALMRQLYATSAPFLDPAAVAAAAAAAAMVAAAAAAAFASAKSALFLAAVVQDEEHFWRWKYQRDAICDCDVDLGIVRTSKYFDVCGGCMYESPECTRIRFLADCTSRYGR